MNRSMWAVMLLVGVAALVAGCCCGSNGVQAPPKEPVTVPPPATPAQPAQPTVKPPAQPTVKPPATPAVPAAVLEKPSIDKGVSVIELPTAQTSMLRESKNFVTRWYVLGPFKFGENDFGGGEQQAAADHAFMPTEAALDGTQKAPEGVEWKEMTFQNGLMAGQCDLDAMYSGIDHAAAYAVAYLVSPQEVSDAVLKVGSDDYLKVWINGKQVFEYKTARRGSEYDQNTVEGIALKKGINRVVVKVVDVVSGWDYYFRLADKDGRPMTFKAP